MFDTPTAFILGAGASWHYGYPTGENLVKDIIKAATQLVSIIDDGNSRGIKFTGIHDSLYLKEKLLGGRDVNQAYEKFYADCKNLAQRLKQINPPVIDYFLGENEDLRDIGKLLISWVILECESKYDRLSFSSSVSFVCLLFGFFAFPRRLV